MLKHRILSALFLIAPLVAALVFAPRLWVVPLAILLYAVAAWEWAGMFKGFSKQRKLLIAGLYWLLMLLLVAAIAFSSTGNALLANVNYIHFIALAGWLIAAFIITRYPVNLSYGLVFVTGLLVLIPPLAYLVGVTDAPGGRLELIMIFLLVWAADIGAYFSGKSLGKHKLAPKVSPGKTWEGFVGGLITAGLVACLLGVTLFDKQMADLPLLLLLAILVVCASVVGDLTVSMFKRHAGVKDMGRVFPGHGGVLDRFDSFSAAVPAYVGLSTLLI